MIAGIDLGTTHSLIGVMDSGFPVLIADESGARLTPSVVHFAGGDAPPVVGRDALPFLDSSPERTVFSVKRLMGVRAGEITDSFPYPIVPGPAGEAGILINGAAVLPEEVAAQILAKLRSDAEASTGTVIDRAVITVPAYFNDAQRSATKRAGELAGIQVERILSEPTAAALAYGLDRQEKSKVAVYDLGGGTFDISILELHDRVFDVRATHGDTHLGGDDFDAATQEWLAAKLGHHVSRETARRCKEALSENTSTEVDGVTVSHDDLAPVWLPIVRRTRAHCEQALFDAGVERDALDAVILVGGSTRMPIVRTFVEEIFGQVPDCNQHPDEAVALGAVIQAGILDGDVRDVTLLDVTPLSLGIETFGGLMNVLIPRNTTIPVKRGEMFTNAVTNQTSMMISVLQGEREMARDNWKLGEFELAFTRAPKGQARVGVQFEIDANGILHVLARDIVTGVDHVVQIDSAVSVSDDAVEEMVGSSVEHAFADMSERIFTETRIKAEEMLPAIQTALDRMGDTIPAAERERILALVADVTSAIAAENTSRLKKLLTALDDATQDLATMLIESLMQD